MNMTSAATGPAEHLGVGAHRRDNPRAALEPRQLGERVGAAVEGQREGRHAAAVDRDRHLAGVDARRRAATSRAVSSLQRMRREPVAARLEAARAADGEEARVLARAVVLDRRRVGVRSRGRPRSRARAASSARTASSCSGGARCEAQAIAISRSSRSGLARTSGSAWSGFADERRKVSSCGSPASATIWPSRTATA